MSTREQNERKFPNWENHGAGGRRYCLDVQGQQGWEARYVKKVDVDEVTGRFYQEIYNEIGTLVEIHYKYPVDYGHQKVEE